MSGKEHRHGAGLVLEMRAGESVVLRSLGGVDSESVTVILEKKDGQTARIRFQAPPSVRIGKPEKLTA